MKTKHTKPMFLAMAFVAVAIFVFAGLLMPGCSDVQQEDTKTAPVEEIRSGKTVSVNNAVVVSADSIASAVGTDVLRRGGNAVDAAVAVAFTLAVTYPQAGNLGGGGFMLVHLAGGESHFIDYRETAPSTASRDMYLDPLGNVIAGKSTRGHLAVGVPGTVAGMEMAHKRFGKLAWGDVLSYSWSLAENGFAVDEFLVGRINEKRDLLSSHPATREIFVDPGLTPGDTLRQPDLAQTIYRIMTEGATDFYEGKTADLIAAEMQRGGGMVTKINLASYRPKFREPTKIKYHTYEILSAPLPSSGGIILSEILQILERRNVGKMGYHSKDHIHLFAEAAKIAYRLRALYMGDADFYPTPWEGLTDPLYVEKLDALIDMSRVLPVRELDQLDLTPPGATVGRDEATGAATTGTESEETTHFSIVDRWGNVVSNTYTLNGSFGSGVTVPGAGFLLNNEMDDFSIKPGHANLYGLVGSEANAIQPGKRMLSSMSPTIVLREGEPFMVVGTPGGSTIPTAVLQVISNVVDFKMTLERAVAEGRVHNQYLPDKIAIEEGAIAAPVIDALEKLGHKVIVREPIGDIQAILIQNGRRKNGDGRIVGCSDPRRNGRAIGY
jgi:gamma-glutamyltranspeptidase/glutathione hydrolase